MQHAALAYKASSMIKIMNRDFQYGSPWTFNLIVAFDSKTSKVCSFGETHTYLT